jgi:hypothetical protein
MTENHDSKGRFTKGNTLAQKGGRARAAALTRRRRRAIARKGYRAMVRKHFGGDDHAQRAYFAALGVYNYEVQAAVTGGLGLVVRRAARHPGPIQDWRAAYYTGDLLTGAHRDVNFYGGAL